MYIQKPLQQYLDDLASAQPAPGGGSAAALSGAMAAALASMVCRLTLGKPGYEKAQAAIEDTLAQTEQVRQRFTELLEEDISAYGQLSAAYKMPRGSDKELTARARAIQKHLAGAAEVPLETVECAARLSQLLMRIAEIGNTALLSDLKTAAALASTASQGAAAMVRVNLRYMRDAELAEELEERLKDALGQVEEFVRLAVDIAGGRV
jgi:formiminotetrahydrofolate cyclodeaminase